MRTFSSVRAGVIALLALAGGALMSTAYADSGGVTFSVVKAGIIIGGSVGKTSAKKLKIMHETEVSLIGDLRFSREADLEQTLRFSSDVPIGDGLHRSKSERSTRRLG